MKATAVSNVNQINQDEVKPANKLSI
jgi:hypothetical protein